MAHINKIISRQLKRAQSAAGSSWHLGMKITPVAESLIGALEKVYCEPQINISSDIDDKAIFRGDDVDLTELLGNLLDNACKAATSAVLLTVMYSDKVLTISVEDDGVGVTEVEKNMIFERGTRADSYEQGHGIGLAIVRDLLESYGGVLTIERSAVLGGADFSIIFES